MSENNSKRFEEISKMSNDKMIKIAKEIVFNPNEPFQERFEGLLVLMEHAVIRIQQLQYGERRLQQVYKQFCDKAINLHKQKRIAEFTERWSGKDVCEDMAKEMKMIEKPNHCYKFAGAKVIEEDCNMCKNRRCEKQDEDYQPSSFIDLLDQKEDLPKGNDNVE